MSTFAERLKLLRLEADLLQKELGDKLGVARGTIAAWETGYRTPELETVKTIADFFQCSVDYLLGRSNVRNPEEEATNAIDRALKDDPELHAFWQELKQRQDLQLLFKQARELSPESIRRAIQVIKLIEERERAGE